MTDDPTALVTSDPQLDDDLDRWHGAGNRQPRVRLLGPVEVLSAQGHLPQRNPRQAFHTELAAYLATHPAGTTRQELADTMFPTSSSDTSQRAAIMTLRRWLGADDTGAWHLPAAGTDDRYTLTGVLVDIDLFQRLRSRGLTRGKDGVEDLRAALRLVTGEPFSQRRPDGYAWLHSEPLDHRYSAMIVDVAHTVATHHLASGEPGAALDAARAALLAGSADDTPWLDLAAAHDALGQRAEADAAIAQMVAGYGDDDLTPATHRVIRRALQHPRTRTRTRTMDSSDHPPSPGMVRNERTVIVMGNIGRRRRRVEVIPESEPLPPAPQQEPAPSREPAPRTPVPSR